MAGMLLSVPFIVVADMDGGGGAVFAIFIAMAPALGILLYVARRTRLVLKTECIEYYNLGVSTMIDWSNVERLLIANGVCGLILIKPSEHSGMRRMRRFSGMSIAGNSYYSEQQQTLMRERRFVDLRAYRRQMLGAETQAKLLAYFPGLRIDIET